VAELGWSKKAIYEITGVTPKYMRPPYGDIDDRVRWISMQMGLTPIIWTAYNGRTFDTQDWEIAGGVVNVSTVISNFDSILAQAPNLGHGFIVLEHDLYQQSVDLAVDYVLPKALGTPALTLEPIINCLGMDASQAYIETAQNASSGAVPSSQIVGASGTGYVVNLTVTAVAQGGDYTGPGTTLTGSGTQTSTGGSTSQPTNAVDAKSSASASSFSALLLLGTTLAMLALA